MITTFNRYIFIKDEIEKVKANRRKFYIFSYNAVLTAIDKILLCDLNIELEDNNPYKSYIYNEFRECDKYQELYPLKGFIKSESNLYNETSNYVLGIAEAFYNSFPFRELFNKNRLGIVFGNLCNDFQDYFFTFSLAAIGLNATLDLDLREFESNLTPKISEYDSSKFENYLNNFKYSLKPYETQTEQNFFKKILSCLSRDYHLSAQVSLLSIIEKTNIDGTYTDRRGELNRIIDFGIFDDNYYVKLLIEVDDKTHEQEKRQKRDIHVNLILERLNIMLIRFYPNDLENTEYIIQQLGKFAKPELRK